MDIEFFVLCTFAVGNRFLTGCFSDCDQVEQIFQYSSFADYYSGNIRMYIQLIIVYFENILQCKQELNGCLYNTAGIVSILLILPKFLNHIE